MLSVLSVAISGVGIFVIGSASYSGTMLITGSMLEFQPAD